MSVNKPMKTKTQHIIDATPEQSRQLVDTGSFVFIEPIPPEYYDVIELMDNNRAFAIARYRTGEQVTIRQEWWETAEPDSEYGVRFPPKTMPSHLHQAGTIQAADVKRASQILMSDWAKLTGINYDGPVDEKISDNIQKTKDYFNQQFAEPKPVTCSNRYCDHLCFSCNGDGIESWICYAYDKDSKKKMNCVNGVWHAPDPHARHWIFKDKPLNIIVNPFLYLTTIKTGD